MSTEHTRLLAREVIAEAYRRYGDGTTETIDFDEVMNYRWPCRGSAWEANMRIKAAVWTAIAEFYEPSPNEY